LLAAFRAREAALMMLVEPGTHDCTQTCEQPSGIAVISQDALASVPECGYLDLKEGLVPELIRAGLRVVAHRNRIPQTRVNSLESYLGAQKTAVGLLGN